MSFVFFKTEILPHNITTNNMCKCLWLSRTHATGTWCRAIASELDSGGGQSGKERDRPMNSCVLSARHRNHFAILRSRLSTRHRAAHNHNATSLRSAIRAIDGRPSLMALISPRFVQLALLPSRNMTPLLWHIKQIIAMVCP